MCERTSVSVSQQIEIAKTCLIFDVVTEADVLQPDDVMQLSLPIEPLITWRRVLAPFISLCFLYIELRVYSVNFTYEIVQINVFAQLLVPFHEAVKRPADAG